MVNTLQRVPISAIANDMPTQTFRNDFAASLSSESSLSSAPETDEADPVAVSADVNLGRKKHSVQEPLKGEKARREHVSEGRPLKRRRGSPPSLHIEQSAEGRENSTSPSPKAKRSRRAAPLRGHLVEAAGIDAVEEVEVVVVSEVTPKKKRSRTKAQAEATDRKEPEKIEESNTDQKPKRRRKTKEEKEAEAMPLAERTAGLRMFIGAHVSAAKGLSLKETEQVHCLGAYILRACNFVGVHNTIINAVHIG